MFKITMFFAKGGDCSHASFSNVDARTYDEAKSWAYKMAMHIGLKIEGLDIVRTAG